MWAKIFVVGHDTPTSIPDVFAHLQTTSSGMGGLTGSGFRVAGAGGLANIASMLGASKIMFRPAEDSDDEDEDEEMATVKEIEDTKEGSVKTVSDLSSC